jgi:predicted nucleotidyltransferase
MRISTRAHTSITKHIKACIPNSEVFLFGSRVNDMAKGGDIDLLLITQEKVPMALLNRARRLIINEIGDQKIDIVNFRKSDHHPFKVLALETAVRL